MEAQHPDHQPTAGKKRILPMMMVLGTVVLYTVGTAWFMISTGNDLETSLGLCVLPFIPVDLGKIALALVLGKLIRNALMNAGLLTAGEDRRTGEKG